MLRLAHQLIGLICLSILDLAALSQPQPNIILIIADDLAWDDSSPYGHPSIRTPNLERMAKDGMRFDRAFLTISSCSPSRSSILTGRYPHQTDAEQLHWPLPADQVTFVEILRQAGYWTAAAGKWHLGEAVKDRFDRIWEADSSGFQLPSGAAAQANQFVESASGDARSGCSQWLEALNSRPDGRPFFLWLAALDPHRPYDEGILETPHTLQEVRVPPTLPDLPAVRHDLALYYDEITRLDRYVGKILDAVTTQGLADSTLIIFISDNGRPFPRDKTTLYDSGIRTPMLAQWKGHIPANTLCPQLISSIDLAPGFLSLAGTAIPDSMVGVSFLPLLRQPNQAIRSQCFAEKHWHDYEDQSRAIRTLHHKLILNEYHDLPMTPPADAVRGPVYQAMLSAMSNGVLPQHQQQCMRLPRPREEFYDLDQDPHELNNLIDDPAYQRVIQQHRNSLEAWQQQTKDQIPAYRTPDEFNRFDGSVTAARIRPRPSKAAMKQMREQPLKQP
jgi:N-sulfoglucosamine sulfohydrolase